MSKIDLFNSICIYTDASTTNDFRDVSHITSSPGYVIVYNNIIRLYGNKFIHGTNSAYGEMYAILMGIKAVYREIINGRLPSNIPINIFSDSLSSIKNLRFNAKRWYVFDNILRKSFDNNAVTNQDIIKEIIAIVNTYNIPINLYHIKSHAQIKLNKKSNLSDRIELKRIRDQFFNINRISITDREAAELCYYNIFVDNFTRYNMKENIESKIYNSSNYKKPRFKNSLITKEDLKIFSNYINGGE